MHNEGNSNGNFEIANEYHRQLWNFKSELNYYLGYNYYLTKEGKLIQARKDGEETAAVIGHNTNSLNCCLQGDFSKEQPTINQRHALREWLLKKKNEYNVPIENIGGHRTFQQNRTCPGIYLTESEIRAMATPPEPPASIEIAKIGYYKRLLEQIRILLAQLQNRLKLGHLGRDARCGGGRD